MIDLNSQTAGTRKLVPHSAPQPMYATLLISLVDKYFVQVSLLLTMNMYLVTGSIHLTHSSALTKKDFFARLGSASNFALAYLGPCQKSA